MKGLGVGIVSHNKDDVEKVKAWLTGTSVEVALIDVAGKEEEFEQAKQALAVAKKQLAKAIRD